MDRTLVAGDLLFAISGDIRGSVPAMIAADTAARRAAKKAKAKGLPRKSVAKVAKKAAKKAVAKVKKARVKVAKARLSAKPKPRVIAAKRAVAKLRALPKPVQKKVLAKIAKPKPKPRPVPVRKPVVVAKPSASGFRPAFVAKPLGGLGPSPSPITAQDDELDSGVMPTEGLEDMADAAFASEDELSDESSDDAGDEYSNDDESGYLEAEPIEDTELEPEGDEPEDLEEPESEELEPVFDGDGNIIGWSPFKAVKKLAKKVVKSTPLKVVSEAIIPGSGLVALGVQHKKKLAKVAKPVAKVLTNKKVLMATAAGLSVVAPQVGLPAMAALAVAAKVQSAVKAASPAIRAGAGAIVKNTVKQAVQKRDVNALRAAGMLAFWARVNRKAA